MSADDADFDGRPLPMSGQGSKAAPLVCLLFTMRFNTRGVNSDSQFNACCYY
jgi:hypothetical protein